MPEATFDEHQHADTPGWATYIEKPVRWWHRCRRSGHEWPDTAPEPPNGFSPSNYTRCARCDAPGHWYVIGQHRYGAIDRAHRRLTPKEIAALVPSTVCTCDPGETK